MKKPWGSSLIAVAPGQPARELCDRADYASRALLLGATPLVARGGLRRPRPPDRCAWMS